MRKRPLIYITFVDFIWVSENIVHYLFCIKVKIILFLVLNSMNI